MHGTIMDTLLTLPRRRHARKGKYKTVTTRAGDLHYLDTGGDKPVILMTPDAPCVIVHHAELIEHLSSDFRVVCFEMPGSGLSFPRAGYSFTAAETADAMHELMNALNIERAILNFSCVNGLHAMNFSTRFPERVSHLVLGQVPSIADMKAWTGYNIPKPLRIPFVGQIVGRASVGKLSDKWFSVSLPRPSEHRESFTKLSRGSLKSGGCFCLASIVQGAIRSPDNHMLGATHPTLMIYGDQDFSHRHTDFMHLTDTIPQATTVEFSGCGHFPNLERPKLFANKLRDFVLM